MCRAKLVEKDKEIIFEDGNGETVFKIQRPFAYDADGEFTYKVKLSLVKGNGKKSEIRVMVDEEWLKAEERKFPVVIDPVMAQSSIMKKTCRVIS